MFQSRIDELFEGDITETALEVLSGERREQAKEHLARRKELDKKPEEEWTDADSDAYLDTESALADLAEAEEAYLNGKIEELGEAEMQAAEADRAEIQRQIDELRGDVGVESYEQAAGAEDMPGPARVRLARHEAAWAAEVDRVVADMNGPNVIPYRHQINVMQTPEVLRLLGVKRRQIRMEAGKVKEILNAAGKHPGMRDNILKQIPGAITDPIAIFDSASRADAFVFMTELQDVDGATVIAAVHLNNNARVSNITTYKLASSYGKEKNRVPNNKWFEKQITDGRLRYIDPQKSAQWESRTGNLLPPAVTPTGHGNNILTRADLVKAWRQDAARSRGLYQETQEGPGGETRGRVRFIPQQRNEAGDIIRDAQTVVTILKAGNRSTLLHELGHVFLESRRRLSLMEGVDAGAMEDWRTLTEWLGVGDIDFGKPLSAADRKRWRDAQEKFAAGFEKYLMEGAAPTGELARAFRAFRKWMADVYRAVKNIFYVDADGAAQAFELSDEVRAVMDRLLASEEEIEASRAVGDAEKLAEELQKQGIPDELAERYQDVISAGADAAKARLMRKLMAELRKEKREELKAAQKEARKQAAAEVWDLPEYRALKALVRPLDRGGMRLSMPALIDIYGDAGARELVKALPFGVVANDGLGPEEAAELLGYGSGEALIEDLKKAAATPPRKAISERVKAATAELESLIHDPEALRAAVEEALHGRERSEWLALEAAVLGEQARRERERIAGQERREEKSRQRQERKEREEAESGARFAGEMFSAENLAAWTKAAADEAARIILGKRMRDISPKRYMAAEKRAAQKALLAAAGARFYEAWQWKRTELMNHELALEAMRAREEYEKGRRYLGKFWPNRKRLRGAMGNEAFDQAIGLLARLGVNQEDKRAAERPRLADWMASATEETGAVAQWILDLDVNDGRPALSGLSLERFREARDAVKFIEHTGRTARELLTMGEKMSFAEAVARLEAATLEAHGQTPPPGADPNAEGAGMAGQFWRRWNGRRRYCGGPTA